MTKGQWRLGLGRTTIILASETGEEREVRVASGEPPTGSDVANSIANNWSTYAETDEAILCYDGFGAVAWSCAKVVDEPEPEPEPDDEAQEDDSGDLPVRDA